MYDLKTLNKQKQKLSIDRRLIQSIDVLQMTDQELSEYILSEAEANPSLDMDTLYAEGSPIKFREKAEWLYKHRRREPRSPAPDEDDGRPDPLDAEYTDDMQDSLKWFLLSQLKPGELGGENERIFGFLIECTDEKGYLDIEPAEAAGLLGVEKSAVERCLDRLRSLQPAGICARDLRGCLLAQISLTPEETAARAIIEDHLGDFAKGYYSLISKKLCIPLSEVHRACGIIKELSPVPASGLYAGKPATEYLVPDALVTVSDGEPEVTLYRSYVPYLAINPYYLELLRETDDDKVREYLDEKLRSAQLLMKNISQRESTFLSCVKIIADIQRDYFTDKNSALTPMTLDDVASRAGVHISTVSRAIRGKYIQSGRGIVPLRKLFSRRLDSPHELDCSADMAKKLIAYFVEGESKSAPLSDQRLSEMLAVKGVVISRRTVAKYREQLGIPSTLSRKQNGS